MAPERIVLVGFMGAGKSTVGRLVATRMGWSFVDLDQLIAAREGATVAELFRTRGEAGFRQAELQAAQAATTHERVVIAAGGGAFAQEATREVLARGALTAWLRCDFDVLLARVGDGTGRPLAESRATMRGILHAREPFYRLADLVVDSSRALPGDLADQIAEAAGSSRAGGASAR